MARFSSSSFTAELARAEIGSTYNQYADSPLRRERLARYLRERRRARIVLVGEAAGYRGARVSGLPFTSERQLTGTGPAEATATIVHRVLGELAAADEVLLWNVVPTHPGTETSNRPPTRAEIEAARPFLERLTRGRRVVAVGRVAEPSSAARPSATPPTAAPRPSPRGCAGFSRRFSYTGAPADARPPVPL